MSSDMFHKRVLEKEAMSPIQQTPVYVDSSCRPISLSLLLRQGNTGTHIHYKLILV